MIYSRKRDDNLKGEKDMPAFEKINLESRAKMEKLLYETIVETARTREQKGEFYEFIVTIEDVRFRTYLSDQELREAITCSIDLLEELKAINNGGLDSVHFDKLKEEKRKEMEELDEEECDIYLGLEVVNSMYTEKIREIKVRIARICRVGGAWYALICSPLMDNIIYVIYEQMVDRFDDEKLYIESVYFILRGVMKIRSEDLPVE